MSADPPSDPAPAAEASNPTPSSSNPPLEPPPAASSLSEDIRQQVEQEQALADCQRRVKELEAELEKLRGEQEALRGEKDGAALTTNQLRTQLSALQSAHHQSTSELNVLQARINAIEGEKRELLEEVERLQQRSSKNTQELFTLRSQRTEASQKIAHLDVEVSELRMAAESSKFNEERSAQALQIARSELLNVSKTAADIEERFGRYRAEKQAELSELQIERDTLTSRITSSDNSYRSLQRTYNDQSRRLAEAHANIATLTSAAAAKKASTSLEFSRLMEENRVLERRGEEARAVIADREAELEKMAEAMAEKERMWEDKCKREERGRKEAEKRSEDLKVVVERLAMASGGDDVSHAATLAYGQKASGKTYTQFYTDYTIQESKLRAAEDEVERLTQVLDEISRDIVEKKPLLDEQASEHARAIERSIALTAELSRMTASRDAFEQQAKSLAATAEHHNEEVTSLQATTEDLARQVQTLLRQIAIRDDPSLASVAIDGAVTSQVTGDIITDQLLEFRSLRGLQEQNQKLLKLTRGLMAKLDAREINRATSDEDDAETGRTLDQATETIKKLHAQLLDAQRRISEANRERDFFSKLLSKGEGLKWPGETAAITGGPGMMDNGETEGVHEQTIAGLRAEIEGMRVKVESEVQEARQKERKSVEEKGAAEVEKAKAEAKAGLLEEQYRMLSETSNLQKQENANLEGQMRQLQASIAQANNERRQALEQVASRQAEADRLRNEAANLRAEKEQWKSTEARLQADFRTVQAERAKLQQLIESLKNVSAESERTRGEEMQRLEKRIEELQRETTALRGQITQAQEGTRAAEKRAEDFDSRLATATASVRAELTAAETLVFTRQQEITALQADVERLKVESENRLRIGQNWQRRGRDLLDAQTNDRKTLADKDKEIEEAKGREEGVKKELEEVQGKLTEAEKKLQESERVVALKEGTVQRLQSELNGKAGQPAAGGDNAGLTAMTAERDNLQQKLTQVEKELSEAKAAVAAPTTAAAPATETPAAAGQPDTEMQAKVDALQKERDAQEARYEDNVIKVNRVNSTLKRRVDELSAENTNLTTRIAALDEEIKTLKEEQASNGPSATPTAAAPTGDSGMTDQAKIDEAVKAAVAAREAELKAEHEKALASASAQQAQPTGDVKPDAELETLKAKQAELEKERDALKAQVDELQTKIKALERQVKTAELTRKILERQKGDAEGKLKKLEEEGGTGSTAAGAGEALSPQAAEFKPSSPAPAASATPAAATPPTGPSQTQPASSPAGRGAAARGRGRGGVAVRGARGGAAAAARPNPVLSAVNATLNQSTPTAPAPTAQTTTTPQPPAAGGGTGTKRPAPEEGEIQEAGAGAGGILSRIQGAAGVGSGERGRVLKRPRGGAARGGAAGRGEAARRPSGAGPGGDGQGGGDAAGGGAAGGGAGAGGGGAEGGGS